MYILRCDGSVASYTQETSFGWWLRDIDISKIKCNICEDTTDVQETVRTQQVTSVDNPVVYQESVQQASKDVGHSVFIPSVDQMTELIDTNNSKHMMILAVINPTLWRQKHRFEHNNNNYASKKAKRKRILLGQNQYLTISTETIEYTSEDDEYTSLHYDFINLKMKLFHKEAATSLLPKLAQIDLILSKIREDILDMRLALSKIRKSVQEDERDISRLLEETVRFTKDVINTNHLDNVMFLLSGNIKKCHIKNWPFYNISIGSMNERNFII